MSAHLVHASKIVRGRPVHPDFPVPPGALAAVHLDARNNVEVDVRGEITPALLEYVKNLGGIVVNSFPEYHSLRARLPLLAVEQLAARPEVKEVQPSEPGYVHQRPTPGPGVSLGINRRRTLVSQLEHFFSLRSGKKRGLAPPFRSASTAFFVGPDFSGDIAHQANVARANSGFDGTGVKVGVLSSGVDSAASEQAAGRLPAVNIIAGQIGSGDEGTAMLEIIYTLAPGATLYFATADGGPASMANNIQALADAGCKIIVDDYYYVGEPAFQDGILAQKINALAASGVIYFSAAGNEGGPPRGEVWEGDFASFNGPLPAFPPTTDTHSFGTISGGDPILVPSQIGQYVLTSSDPLGQSSNDYDLFILNSAGDKVVASSTNVQNGTQDPQERIDDVNHLVAALDWLVIVRNPGASIRALRADVLLGQLNFSTLGATFGHNAAAGAFGISAIDVRSALGGAFTTGSPDFAERFSSVGPRRMFFHSDGAEITPGNVLFGANGGILLKKPDFTAADGVTTGLAGFAPFFGTSAAAPHAAAIAALVLQAKPGMSPNEMRAVLSGTVIGPGSYNYGAGIVMASSAIAAASLNCSYSIAPAGEAFPDDGGSGTISVNTQPGCPWTITTQPPWVTLSSTISDAGSNPHATGAGTVTYQVGFNQDPVTTQFGPERSATFLIGNQSFAIEQEPYNYGPYAVSNLIGSMPHIAAQENWTTTFTLINKSAAIAQARFSLFGNDGIPLLLPLAFPQQSSSDGTLLGATLKRTLAPNASLAIDTAGPATSPVQVGSAQVAAIGSVDGFAIFHQILTTQEAVVPLETRSASSYLLPYDNTTGMSLGVAMANASLFYNVLISVIIRDDTGAMIGDPGAIIPLAPNGHASFVLSDQFPITAHKRGTIEFDNATDSISVLGIRFTPPNNALTTIPALANVGTGGGSIAHLASGDGWQTTFVLVNAGTSSAPATLKFFSDQTGLPLSLPLAFPQSGGGTTMTVPSYTTQLAAGATMEIVSSGAPQLLTGSAQLSTTGNVSGFVIFRHNNQEAVVPLESRNANAYIMAFDNTNGTATGIALNAVSSQQVNVPVVVRDDTGAQIATDTITLAANGHYAFTLVTDKYPGTANIRGTIEFDKPANAQIGALGIRIPAGAAHTYTTLPALAKE